MPKRTDIKSILIIGAGPIVIGQACEFDYSGTQACKALREEGYRIILVNSNPATIMTDPEFADATYIEPVSPEIIEKIIQKEKPDAILPTVGGQTALNVALKLDELGILEKYNVELIGVNAKSIAKAESRELFNNAMDKIGLRVAKGSFCRDFQSAHKFLDEIDFPVIIRPSFTLGGSGGGIAENIEEFENVVEKGLKASPIHEVLMEESLLGWKEFELEVVRDLKDNVIIVCSIENIDPMGVHTGDSITVAPALTLSDKIYQKLRDASIAILREIGVETGGSNVQFAINPETDDIIVIEMNPRVSRSSALASKATGFPIAKIAAKLSVGMTLDEIQNDITKTTYAAFEPVLDYVVTKVPRWDFEKFAGADTRLTVQMKSVGEAMSIGRTFKESLQKGFRSLEIGLNGFESKSVEMTDEELLAKISKPSAYGLLSIKTALERGIPLEEIYEITKVDKWFLNQFLELIKFEKKLKSEELTEELLREAKELGFADKQIGKIIGKTDEEIRSLRKRKGIFPTYKTIDTCAAEFESYTNYLYSTYDEENESKVSDRKKVMILGGGPNRIGQGIEFDYCCVQTAFALRNEGFEVLMVNCNPETVSTDYDISDKLYFEPVTFEDVMNIYELEKPEGVLIQFGGQTPLKIIHQLVKHGVKVLGTSSESIDIAEDRERFDEFLTKFDLKAPASGFANEPKELKEIALKVGFPLLVRPSYVLGGRAMEIVYDFEDLDNYLKENAEFTNEHPILLDSFLEDAFEFDVDVLSDGEETYIAGIMQHVEEAGVHSGDSSCVLPPYMINLPSLNEIKKIAEICAKELNIRGLMNIQIAVKDGEVYILEVNPRASRTVPFVSKAINVPLARIAALLSVGRKLFDFNLPSQNYPSGFTFVKKPVFPFNKFPKCSKHLGPEMKSTGEVMGIAKNLGNAFAKALLGANYEIKLKGSVFISVHDNDQLSAISIARDFIELGYKIFGTRGTAEILKKNGIKAYTINKISENKAPNILTLLRNKEVDLVFNTPLGKESRRDEYLMADTAYLFKVPMITTISGIQATIRGIRALQNELLSVSPLQEIYREI
ncbi:MAG: carbamoyl-phosphate synthase large subunit [Calditrichaeota bacterium]|nr:MAG: carbamoyl-phosphate synthase large subunit [Calditrichota bacterium]